MGDFGLNKQLIYNTMSNQNTGDKPQITQGEWKHWQDSFGDYLVRNESGCIADVYCNENEPEGTEEANAKMIATAGNLSQKYGSLEAMEQQLIGLKEQHHNDILLAQSMPDYDQVLDWLDEKHGIVIYNVPIEVYPDVLRWEPAIFGHDSIMFTMYNTRYEALNEGIKEGLKLIKK